MPDSNWPAILAIDDTPESLALMAEVLGRNGYRVRPADSGELALSSVAAWKPDLILLDIHLAGLDGIEVCRRLRGMENTAEVPIILVSSFSDPDDWKLGLAMGASDFLAKPIHPEELLARVQTHLNAAQGRRDLLRLLEVRETLLQELYHRTKNTLQVIQGVLSLQAGEFPDNADLQKVVSVTESRIMAIALVHKLLYRTRDLSHVPMGEYVSGLVDAMVQSQGCPPGRIACLLDLGDESFLLDTAVPLGLITNELLGNSFKHAFPGHRNGTIHITLRAVGGSERCFEYADDGIGFPPGKVGARDGSFGLGLVRLLAEEQLAGTLQLGSEGPGMHCRIVFKPDLYSDRLDSVGR